ncbi:sigma-54-dependent Fis family transcriptional regulator [Candidatus Uabimicrobium amorphum]|uniref:ATPase AAA n=1 Tax=Uabimicrobium amorphum TaxID=2596890 RepID=A0A5S9F600_UABAM|nr:sigma 54-interacting transcriptional regulator [Candidatus Uabimicrobium amorphum]BBM87158.1 ATPase AAA [Candidatus Uabimicrobium amorphum]
MNKDEFFRKATLRICGSLEIEKAMSSTLEFLCQWMPVDIAFLQDYDKNFDSMRTIAIATATEGRAVNLLTPLSVKARELQRKYRGQQQKVRLFSKPSEDKLSKEMLQFHGIEAKSLIVLTLESGGQVLGVLVLCSHHRMFSQKHCEWFSLLSEPFAIAMANTIQHREVIALKNLLADDNKYLHGELRRLSGDEIVGASFGLRDVMHKVQQVAALDSTVLLLGETGVGKDVVANAIHYSSLRSSGPFLSVNCGTIPDTLIDSELFGHEKGAFTGALSQKRGRFERANKGTIFLDEIGELPLQTQVHLLNVLENKKIERVGGTKTIPLDIRIIAATNRDLEEMVKLHQFREDLWFRLNVFPIWIPPLRARKVDIPALVQHFINLKSKELKLSGIPTLSPNAIAPLMQYNWPGNIRELKNIIERALIVNPSGPLNFEHFFGNSNQEKNTLDLETSLEEIDNLDEVIAKHIRQVLRKTKGKINGVDGAATLLGVNPSTLRNRMKKMAINYGRAYKNLK